VQNIKKENSKFIDILKRHQKTIAISAATITSIVAATILVTFKKEQIKKYFSPTFQPKPQTPKLEPKVPENIQKDDDIKRQKEIEKEAVEQQRLALKVQEKNQRDIDSKKLKINDIQSKLNKYKEEYPQLVQDVQPIVEPIKNALEVLSKYPNETNDKKVKELEGQLNEATKDIDMSLKNMRELNEEISKEKAELGQLESIASKK
jgi:DNA repair exonuclease SbcCD ATPase subunit